MSKKLTKEEEDAILEQVALKISRKRKRDDSESESEEEPMPKLEVQEDIDIQKKNQINPLQKWVNHIFTLTGGKISSPVVSVEDTVKAKLLKKFSHIISSEYPINIKTETFSPRVSILTFYIASPLFLGATDLEQIRNLHPHVIRPEIIISDIPKFIKVQIKITANRKLQIDIIRQEEEIFNSRLNILADIATKEKLQDKKDLITNVLHTVKSAVNIDPTFIQPEYTSRPEEGFRQSKTRLRVMLPVTEGQVKKLMTTGFITNVLFTACESDTKMTYMVIESIGAN